MDRKQEHYALKDEIIPLPASLDNAMKKAHVRALKRAVRYSILTPLGTCAAVFALFIMLVNFSPTVALAMEQIPGLQRLAGYVTFSPSLSEAVEHGHVQSLGLEQVIDDDVIMRVEHVILDGSMLHIFYEFESSVYTDIGISIGARGTDLDTISDCCMNLFAHCSHYSNFIPVTLLLGQLHDMETDQMRYATVGFEEAVPRTVIFEGEVLEMTSGTDIFSTHVIGRYNFIIIFDEIFAHQDIIEVNYRFDIEDQHMVITTVELNPVHTRVNIESEWENNTEHLQRLVFFMESENGKRFYPPDPGTGGLINMPVGGTGNDGPWRMGTHFLESAFFSENDSLTIFIIGVEWMGMEWMGPDTIILEEPIEIRIR